MDKVEKRKFFFLFSRSQHFLKVAKMEIWVAEMETWVAEMETEVAEMETKNVKKWVNTRVYRALI